MTTTPDRTSETTYLVWGCEACGKTYKVEPEVFEPDCRCENPVPEFRPSRETQVHGPAPRPVRALGDDEARIIGLLRARRRLRITIEFEADIHKDYSIEGEEEENLLVVVDSPEGLGGRSRQVVNLFAPTIRVEAAEDAS